MRPPNADLTGAPGDPPPADSVTGTVEFAGYVLEVGEPFGTSLSPRGRPEGGDVRPLARPLKKGGGDRGRRKDAAIGDAVDTASEVTAKTERAVALFRGLVEGKALEPEQLSAEVDSLVSVLERLDRQGRHREALRLARALSALLALLMRWAALVRSLGIALSAAEELNDAGAISWAKHELGTLHLAAEDPGGAERNLGEAREIRQRLGDRSGLAATDHNLQVLCQQLRQMLRDGKFVQKKGLLQSALRSPLLLALVAAGVLAAGGAAGGVIDVGGGGNHDQSGLDDEVPSGETGVSPTGAPGDSKAQHGKPADGDAKPGGVGAGGGQDQPSDGQPPDGTPGDGGPGNGGGKPLDRGGDRESGDGTEMPTVPLSVDIEGEGSVTSDSGDIECGTVCDAKFPADAAVVLTARPDKGGYFAGLSVDGGRCPSLTAADGDIDDGAQCTVTMDVAHSVIVTFQTPPG